MRIKRHSRFYSYLVILLICVSNLSFAKSKRQIGDILIIIPNSAMPYKIIVTNIRRELRRKHRGERVNVLNLSAKSFSGTILKGNRLVVTLGAKSLDFYLKSGINTPFISSFITEGAFAKLVIDNPQKNIIARRYVGGISLEQPVYRLVSLVKKLQGNIKSIGVVLGPNSNIKFPSLRRQIQRQLGSVLNVANIHRNDNPVKKLRQIFKRSQLVLVIPDKARFNRSLAHWVVTLSYKYKVPVISYSKKYTQAGALISLYSEPEQIGRQTAEMIIAYLHAPKAKPLKLNVPRYFQIAINHSVSQAFGLKLPKEDMLLHWLYSTAQ